MIDWKPEIRQRLAALKLAPTREAEIVEELAQHLEDRYGELLTGGATDAQASREVLGELRESELLTRELRRVERHTAQEPIILGTNRSNSMIADLWQDLRYGARMLMKNPGFTFIAVLTLTLGIGVNTALFTVFNAFMLKPLPLKDPGSLVNFSGVISGAEQSGERYKLFSYLDYLDYRDRNTTLADLVAWNKAAVLLGEAQSRRDDLSDRSGYIFGQIVSANYLTALGAEMALGRGFLPEEDRTPGTHPVVVLSHRFWQRQFDGDPNIVGRTIRMQSQPFTVVGVTSPSFVGTTIDNPEFWVPLMMRDQIVPLGLGENHKGWLTDRDADLFVLLGRLKPGVARGKAQAEMSLIAQQLAQDYPGSTRKTGVVTTSAASFVSFDAKLLSLIVPLLLAFGLVLLIACANVANLLLARAAVRQKEIGVRLALGASRRRVIRQLLTESVLISAIGGLTGLLAASWTLQALYHVLLARLPELPAFLNLELDYRIFGFTLLVALIAGVAAGLAPALQASRPDLASALKDEGSTLGQHLSQSRLRNGLIVTQIAMSLALLIGTGLLLRNLQRAQTIDVGFEPQNLLSVSINLNAAGEQSPRQQEEFRRQLGERVRALPGVKSISQAFRQPSSGQLISTPITIAGQVAPGDRPLRANYNFVSSRHFETLGIQIVRGRGFTEQEANSSAAVVVVSEATAQKFWPGQDAIGQRIGIAAALSPDNDPLSSPPNATVFPFFEVIGIARDTRSGWVYEKDVTYLYVPLWPDNHRGNYLLVRAEGDVQRLIAAVRAEAVAIDPRLSAVVQRTSDHLDEHMTPFRTLALIAGVLGALALLLASMGLYGVMSFVVTQRTREIGVRIALGAQSGDVVRLFLKEGLRLTVIGLSVGLAGGVVISRLLATVLVDLSPLDPLAFGGVSIVLTLVALLACWIPARRATRVEPLVALRCE
ncbi:MAG TPA: ABC transporter permease [Blastocatellia bacterium]|nr:ABC transporter permease [Blastocatellia bacterium]